MVAKFALSVSTLLRGKEPWLHLWRQLSKKRQKTDCKD